ncbi:MAG: PD40 domain-containing protein [Thermoanaerobacteraceae bacterium]|nr:PD40 domain-containing protein [Thermoanaerobacteraceae bacterium]
MKCQEAKQYIHSYLDGRLTEMQEQVLYQHLSVCPSCQKELNIARQLDELLDETCTPVEPPADFTQLVMAQIPDTSTGFSAGTEVEPESRKRFSLRRWLEALRDVETRVLVPASYIAVFLVIGILFMYGNSQLQGLVPGSPGNKPKIEQQIVTKEGDGQEETKETSEEQPSEPERETPRESETVPSIPKKTGSIDKTITHEQEKQNKKISENIAVKPIFTVILTPVVTDRELASTHPVFDGEDRILYLSQRSKGEDRYTVWETTFNGKESKMVAAGQYGLPLMQGGGVWSYDHSQIAYVTKRNGYLEIWVNNLEDGYGTNMTLDTTGKALERVQQDKEDLWAYNPVWSSQGEIVYLTTRAGNIDIMAIDAEGNNRVITKTPARETNPAWSPEGERIAYFRSMSEEDGKTVNQIYVVNKDGSDPKAVTRSFAAQSMVPSWAPGGDMLAVNIGQMSPKAERDRGIWLVDLAQNRMVQLTTLGGGRLVKWSPDGSKIAFTDENGVLYVLFVKEDLTVDQICQITPEADADGEIWVDWLDDSQQLLFDWAKPGGTRGIWRATLPDVAKEHETDRTGSIENTDAEAN